MARVIPDDVRTILETEITDEALEVAISAASMKLGDTVESVSHSLTDADLALIERYLAAHYATAGDPQADQIQVGDVRVQFESPDSTSPGLEETRYGRTAMSLDPTDELRGDEADSPGAIFQTFGHDKDDW